MAASVVVPSQGIDFTRLRPRAVIVHNVYQLLEKKIVDSTQPGGNFYVSMIDPKAPPVSTELFDFTNWEADLTLGLSADSYKITFPNFDGKYSAVFRAGEEIAIYVGYPKDPDNYGPADLTLLIIGRIDEAELTFDKSGGEVIELAGRNYAAPFLDSKVSKKFQDRTATQIIKELVSIYGMGMVQAEINIEKDRLFNKTVLTRNANSAKVINKFNTEPNTNIPLNVLGSKNQGVTRTPALEDNVIGNNSTVWDVFQRLASALADEATGKEYKVYIGGTNGRTLYFGPRQDYDPKNNQIKPSVTLTYGVNTSEVKLKETTQFLKTRIIMRQYVEAKKGIYDVIIPDDLSPADLPVAEKAALLQLRKRYGTRDWLIKDQGRFIQGNVQRAKKVGLARLRESARLTFTGTLVAPGDPSVTKEGAVRLQGIPDLKGITDPQFPYRLSQELNAVYYIEGAKHAYGKEGKGYQMTLDISTRKQERKKATVQTATAEERSASNEPEEQTD